MSPASVDYPEWIAASVAPEGSTAPGTGRIALAAVKGLVAGTGYEKLTQVLHRVGDATPVSTRTVTEGGVKYLVDLAPGDYVLQVTPTGFQPTWFGLDGAAASAEAALAIPLEAGGQLVLSPVVSADRTSATGSLTYADTGAPAAGIRAIVSLESCLYSSAPPSRLTAIVTGADGGFVIPNLSRRSECLFALTVAPAGDHLGVTSTFRGPQSLTTPRVVPPIAIPLSSSVSGVVTDAVSGAPIAGAEIVAAGRDLASSSASTTTLGTATTDADGRYVITGLRAAAASPLPVSIRVSEPLHESGAVKVQVAMGSNTPADVALRPRNALTGTVTGIPLDGSDPVAATGMTVSAYAVSGSGVVLAVQTGAVGSDGTFSVPVDPGEYVVGLSRGTSGFEGEVWQDAPARTWKVGSTISATAGARVTVDATGQSAPIAATVTRLSDVRGRVVDGSGLPLGGVEVRAERWDSSIPAWPVEGTAVTDADGGYRITGLTAGRYEFFAESTDQSVMMGGSSATFSAGSSVSDIDFVLRHYPTLSGRLTTKDGTSMAGAVVQLLEGGSNRYSTTADADGAFRFDGRLYPSDEVKLRIVPPTASRAAPFFYGGGTGYYDPASIPIVLEGDKNVVLGDIPVKVVGSLTGAFSESEYGGTVTAYDADGTKVAETTAFHDPATGTRVYRFDTLEPGTYWLRAVGKQDSARWYPDAVTRAEAQPVTVTTGATTVADIQVPRRSRLSGVARDAAGEPLAGATVTWTAINQFEGDVLARRFTGTTTTKADGSYSTLASPGDLTVSVVSGTLRGRWTNAAGSDVFRHKRGGTVANITLATTGTIAGTALVGDFAGVRATKVQLFTVSGTRVATVDVAADGSYSAPDLAAGSYVLRARTASNGAQLVDTWSGGANTRATATAVTVGAGETVVADLHPHYARALLGGTITAAATGEPVHGVRVGVYGETGDAVRVVPVDQQGRWMVPDLPAGRYGVKAIPLSGEYAPKWWEQASVRRVSDTVVLGAVSKTSTDITLDAAATITGAVVLPEVATGGVVEAHTPDGTRVATTTIVDGRFVLDGLPAADYRLFVSAEAAPSAWTPTLTVAAGDTVDAGSIVLPDQAHLSGTITGTDGPTWITLFRDGQRIDRRFVESRFLYGELREGGYTVKVESYSRSTSTWTSFWYGGATRDDATSVAVVPGADVDLGAIAVPR